MPRVNGEKLLDRMQAAIRSPALRRSGNGKSCLDRLQGLVLGHPQPGEEVETAKGCWIGCKYGYGTVEIRWIGCKSTMGEGVSLPVQRETSYWIGCNYLVDFVDNAAAHGV